jgi:pimeloyl-ACP methyl ester carboxylesterase
MADAIVHGVRLHYQRIGAEGSATRVVFVHGLVMDNLASWYFSVANTVASSADVLLYDLRGHGRSEHTPHGYGVDRMLGDLAGLLDATLGRAPVCVVGNSFGALLAVAFARAFPGRTSGLVLVDGHLGGDGFGAGMARTLSLRGEDADRAIAASFRDWLGRHSERKRTRLADQARALVERTSLVRDLLATPPFTPDDFRQIDVPVLAMYGEHSDIRAQSESLLAHVPRCRIEVLPGCTHSILWEATAEVRARTAAFCASLPRPTSAPAPTEVCA